MENGTKQWVSSSPLLHAIDLDLDINDTINYKLVTHEMVFEIDKNNGRLRPLIPLDREQIDSYRITIMVGKRYNIILL